MTGWNLHATLKETISVLAMPVFDATVIYEGKELFKGRGVAGVWAEKLAKEIECPVTVEKIGAG